MRRKMHVPKFHPDKGMSMLKSDHPVLPSIRSSVRLFQPKRQKCYYYMDPKLRSASIAARSWESFTLILLKLVEVFVGIGLAENDRVT